MPDRQAEIGNNRMALSAPVFHIVVDQLFGFGFQDVICKILYR